MPSQRDLESAETESPAPLDATAPPSASDAPPPLVRARPEGPPVAQWDRYELGELLGKGGMGAVYRARDKRLGRAVALKFILGAHPNLVMRFLQEARAQARIDHPHVCRVYEVGEIEGRAYIAMQYVAGEQLGKVAAQLTLDEKVAVLRDVAGAIHEAHKLGIVHRDLKPSNILCERGEDGRWFPVVMDFGLARESSGEAGLTESGALLGTPAYMSPEQARGDQRAVDRRSDVYSLGATFYELLAGRPPFAHQALALALEEVLHKEPPPPRALEPSLPVDLETIALKCLAKEPERRYASARALADDLGRYLDGEPILGRRPSLLERWRRRARRNRALVAVTATSLVILLAAAGVGVRTWVATRRERARAIERARLAEALGQDTKEIEWLLRAAYQLPAHDTTPEREIIRARMQRIAATPHELGPVGDAAVHAALGRGHLALHEWREADDELGRAADAGLDTPGLHAARGRALGELYHRALEDARRAGDRAWLAAREAELGQKFLTPALAELERSRAGGGEAGDDPDALEALMALYRRDYARAETRALAAVARAPWLFEARKVAADAAYAAAAAEADRGRYDAAAPGLERASALYAAAADVARSDPSVHEAAAAAWLERAELAFRQGRVPGHELDEALRAVDVALVADPRDARAHTTRAWVLLRRYRTPSLRAGDLGQALDAIAAAASRAVASDARATDGWDALGNAHIYRGLYELIHGGEPEPWWHKAEDELAQALRIEPNNPWAHNDLGVVHRHLGSFADEHGRDPLPEYQAAIASYARAAEIDPAYVYARSNQTDIEAALAEHQAAAGRDPGATVAEATRAGERCLAIDPSFSAVLENMARAELALAAFLVEAKRDPGPALARARAELGRSLALRATNSTVYFYRVRAARLEARHLLTAGGDATETLAAGRQALAEALRFAPDCDECHAEAARLELVAADAAAQAGRPAAPLVDRAAAEARRAIAMNGRNAVAQLAAAAASLRRGRLRDGDAAEWRAGLAHADAAVALNPRLGEAHAVRAALLTALSRE